MQLKSALKPAMTAYVFIIFHLETVWLLSQKTVNAARSEAGWARFDRLYSGPILGPALQIQSGSSGNRKSTLAQPKVPVEKPHWGHHQELPPELQTTLYNRFHLLSRTRYVK